MAKTYQNKGFEDKIQINLAKICGSGNDILRIVQVERVLDFTCELCGHQHLSFAYVIKNESTGLTIKVGSECVNHFGFNQTDIDKWEGLMKLVEKSTNKARDYVVEGFGKELFAALPEATQKMSYFKQEHLMQIFGSNYENLPESVRKQSYLYKQDIIVNLGNEKFKALSREEKFNLTYKLYRQDYAERLMEETARGEHMLTKEEMNEIIGVGFEDKMTKAMEASAYRKHSREVSDFTRKVYGALNAADDMPEQSVIDGWMDEASKLDAIKFSGYTPFAVETVKRYLTNHQEYLNRQKAEEERIAKFNSDNAWLLNYTGNNAVIEDIKIYAMCYRHLSENQLNYARKLYDAEMSAPAVDPAAQAKAEIENMLNVLVQKFPNVQIYIGIRAYFHRYGKLSVKQEACIRDAYKRNCK